MKAWRFWGGLATTVLVVVAGCSGGFGGGGTQVGIVKGKVSYKGKPLSSGMISFNPMIGKAKISAREAQIHKDGTFGVRTIAGTNIVTVQPSGRGAPKVTEEKTIEVKPGENA